MFKLPLLIFLSASTFTSSFAKDTPALAKNFHAVTVKNEKITLSDFKDKVVLIDFWASWCITCRKELPFLIELYHQNENKDFVVLAINLDENRLSMKKFLEKVPSHIPFPVLIDDKGKIPTLYNIQAMPSTILVDKHGYVRYVHKGFKESYKKEYLQEVKALLSEDPDQPPSLPQRE